MRKPTRLFVGVLVAAALLVPATPGFTAKVKNCGTTTESTSPNNNAVGTPFTTTTTETQTSACNSNSDTGETTTSTTVNGGGHPK